VTIFCYSSIITLEEEEEEIRWWSVMAKEVVVRRCAKLSHLIRTLISFTKDVVNRCINLFH